MRFRIQQVRWPTFFTCLVVILGRWRFVSLEDQPGAFITSRQLSRTPRCQLRGQAQSVTAEQIQTLKEAAESGDPQSQALLGKFLLEGNVVARDETQAKELLTMAAEKGEKDAQFNLGMMLVSGETGEVAQDVEKGAYWLEEAAKQGSSLAEYYFGMMCATGDGLPLDESKALQYLRAAADKDIPEAQFPTAMLLYENTEHKDWSATYFNAAAQQGDCRAQYQIARMFLGGIGLEENAELGAQWASTAANAGFTDAQYLMGTLLLAGQGVEENKAWAAHWFEQAAQQGHMDAQYNLALMLQGGDGIPEDKEKADFWLLQASAQGDEAAVRVARGENPDK